MRVEDTDLFANFAFGMSADQGGGGIFNDGGTLTVTGPESDLILNSALGTSGRLRISGVTATRISREPPFSSEQPNTPCICWPDAESTVWAKPERRKARPSFRSTLVSR